MRHLLLVLIACLPFTLAHATDSDKSDGYLNKIKFDLSAEQWVLSKSALVTVTVNASVNSAGLEKLQLEIMDKLGQISKDGDWHIIRFDRASDQSGLEKVMIEANARILSSNLVSLRDKAKQVSKAGMNFTIDSINYTPSEDELRGANIILRGMIYQQAKDEVDRLNKRFPDQNYSVHNLDFTNDATQQQPNLMMNAMRVASPANAPIVSDKVTVNASVVLAAMPNHNLLKNIN